MASSYRSRLRKLKGRAGEAAEMMDQDGRLTELLRRLEETLMDPAVRADSERAAALIGDDFTEIGKSGRIYDKAAIIAELQKKSESTYAAPAIYDFKVRCLSSGIALVTYRSERSASGYIEEALRSSIWQWSDEGWRICFHQGTLLQGTLLRAPERR
jgi:hypothetical protein